MSDGIVFSDLGLLVEPRSVVIVGASDREASVGGRTLTNIADHSRLEGELFLVNPSRSTIRGQPCFPSVADLPAVPDLAVVTVPAAAVPGALADCAAKGIGFAIILSSGFAEAGDEGLTLDRAMKEVARRTGIRLYGPNCPGLTNINKRLGFTFSPAFAQDLVPGPIGVATQGGGLGRSVLQAMERGAGFGLWASTGNEVDLQVADFIHYMAGADDISVIVTLLEGIKDGPRFIAAARRAAENGKPIVALKVGRSEYGMRAAQSHTASLTGSAEVNSAVFRQLGIIEVDDVDELVDVASLLVKARPTGRERVVVFGSSGGACALAADMIGQVGLTLAELAPETTDRLAALLPSYAAIGNPIDTTTVTLTDPGVIESTLAAVSADPEASLIVLPIPLDYGDVSLRNVEHIVAASRASPVPFVPVWMSERPGPGYRAFAEAGLTMMRSMRNAARAMRRFADHGRWLADGGLERLPLATAATVPAAPPPRMLTEVAGKALLAGAGLPVPRSGLARDADDAARLADGIGYPVVLKVVSPDILHKSDVGGVRVGIGSPEDVRSAFSEISHTVGAARPDARIEGVLVEHMLPAGGVETLVSVSRDPTFGHVMTFGLGGIHVELFRDIARRLLPIERHDAERLIREVRAYPLLAGARGRSPQDIDALLDVLVGVSRFVVSRTSEIDEIELNPVWVGRAGGGAVILDALVTVRIDQPDAIPAAEPGTRA